MTRGGFSQMFWIAIVAIIAVPVSIDRILASHAAGPITLATTETKSQFDWQHKKFAELGVAVDLPCEPQADQPADFGPRIESYAGAIEQIYYKFGRHTVDSANPFDAKTYLSGEVSSFRKAPGNSDVKAEIHKIDWFGKDAYEAEITCSRFGKPMRVHFRVRGTDHDWIWLSSMYPTKTEAAGEHAWKVIVDSFAIDRPSNEEATNVLASDPSSQPLGFDKYRFVLPHAGIQFDTAARLTEDSAERNQNWGDLIYQGSACDMTYKLVAGQTHDLIDLLSFAKSHEAGSKEQMGSDYRSVSIHPGNFQGHESCTVDRTYLDSGKLWCTRKLYFQAGSWIYELRADYPDSCRLACSRRWSETLRSVKLASTSEQVSL